MPPEDLLEPSPGPTSPKSRRPAPEIAARRQRDQDQDRGVLDGREGHHLGRGSEFRPMAWPGDVAGVWRTAASRRSAPRTGHATQTTHRDQDRTRPPGDDPRRAGREHRQPEGKPEDHPDPGPDDRRHHAEEHEDGERADRRESSGMSGSIRGTWWVGRPGSRHPYGSYRNARGAAEATLPGPPTLS